MSAVPQEAPHAACRTWIAPECSRCTEGSAPKGWRPSQLRALARRKPRTLSHGFWGFRWIGPVSAVATPDPLTIARWLTRRRSHMTVDGRPYTGPEMGTLALIAPCMKCRTSGSAKWHGCRGPSCFGTAPREEWTATPRPRPRPAAPAWRSRTTCAFTCTSCGQGFAHFPPEPCNPIRARKASLSLHCGCVCSGRSSGLPATGLGELALPRHEA